MAKSLKITLLDYAILGLVYQRPLTGYAIRKEFELTALGNYSSSPGSIYPALKRIQSAQLVDISKLEGQRGGKYRITRNGIHSLRMWLERPLTKEDVSRNLNELLLRFAFMGGLVSLEIKLAFLTSFQDLLEEHIADLQRYLELERSQLPLHGRLAFEHGIASCKATLDWSRYAYSNIKNASK